MNWNRIVGFYYVAKQGNFTKAAENVFVTQSALTHQIKALEAELGCLLFERIGKRKILLTAAGKRLFAFAEEMVEQYGNLIDDLGELKGSRKGQLRIAAPFTTLYHLLPIPLEKYIKQFPWVELTVLDRAQQDVIHFVREGDVDFGFVLESKVPSVLDSRRWKKVETVLLAPKDHPLAVEKQIKVEQLARYPLILPPKGAGFHYRKKLDELFSLHGLEYRVVMESSNVELSSVYCEMGLGVSFATIVEDIPTIETVKKRNLVFIPLSPYFEPDYIALVMRRNAVLPSYRKAFVETIFC
ncbi:MAG: LysR family transcriptional regulator [Chloroflexi bacterium]|nr:LysR family transcriptional regulator [Chloroflexota bacterium]